MKKKGNMVSLTICEKDLIKYQPIEDIMHFY